MRPTSVEVLRGLQGVLASDIGREVQSLFGQDALQTGQMLLEMLANELDGAADSLFRDNEALVELLGRGAGAVRSLDAGLAEETQAALAEQTDGSLKISALSARNSRLRGLLERLLVVCEDAAAGGKHAALMAVRADAYRHLRDVATRGWSFWDMLSFRERMAQLRAGGL